MIMFCLLYKQTSQNFMVSSPIFLGLFLYSFLLQIREFAEKESLLVLSLFFCMKITFTKNANKIRKAVLNNGGYCPCRLEHTEDTLCMCKEFRKQIADPNFKGNCHCNLYSKE